MVSWISRNVSPRGIAGYLLLLVFGGAVVSLVLYIGSGPQNTDGATQPPALIPGSKSIATEASVHVIEFVIRTLGAVILLGALLSALCKYVGQPPVIGEVLAGLILGPSLLGFVSPDAVHFFVPDATLDPQRLVSTSLKTVAQLGVILYMFLVGLELNESKLKNKAHAAIAISHASIVIPFVLGVVLSLWLYPRLSSSDVPFPAFALFLGIAMSITAFPVLARILTDRGLNTTYVGSVALSCAAADDVTAWCLLSLVVGVAKSNIMDFWFVLFGAAAYIGLFFVVVKPLVRLLVARLESRSESLSSFAISLVYVAVLASAAITEWIGIHAIFGAFLLGVVVPTESRLAQRFLAKLREPVTILLLPAFFAYTGMRTEIGLLSGWNQWAICGVIVLVATLGKFGGTLFAARYAGESWRDSSILAILMNTRGLMELIVLNIGLDLGVISPTLFTMMVIMALVTTLMTSPIVYVLSRDRHGAANASD